MQFATLREIRRGSLVFRILRSLADGKRFVAVDRWERGALVHGPLISERNFGRLWRLIGDHVTPGFGAPNTSLETLADRPSNRDKIQDAIQEASVRDEATSGGAITVLPSMPEYRYVNTCPDCGCHVASFGRLGVGSNVKVCSGCGHVYPAQ